MLLRFFAHLTYLLLILPFCLWSAFDDEYRYRVEFKGIDSEEVTQLLQEASQLVCLAENPPLSFAALKRRAEEDIPHLLAALQSKAYYHAHIDISIDTKQCPAVHVQGVHVMGPGVFDTLTQAEACATYGPILLDTEKEATPCEHVHPALVTLKVEIGSIYTFSSFKILPSSISCDYPFDDICPTSLGINIGEPAYPSTIIDAFEILQEKLEDEGYPLSKLVKRDVIADASNKTISVTFYVDSGPLATFGTTEIIGTENILPCFFIPKINWTTGNQYNPCQINRTINALEASGLFSSINITHDESTLPDGSLPMQINVEEARHRSIGFGVGYATDLGPGASVEWEHRNMRHRGERLSLVANVWQIKQEGFVRYITPDFCCPRQDLIWKAEVEHEITKGFREASASLSSIIERQVTDRLRISYGGKVTWLKNTHSNNNRSFNLVKAPMQLLWNGTNSLLDPTSGYTLHIRATPTLQTLSPRFAYSTHLVTTTAYKPLDACHRFVLAGKATFGSIWGASRHSIPPSERFYAGSDTLLRGYRYMTVSPLGFDHKPIGGRSLMVYSMEMRMRVYDPFGLVAFYDIGNVYSETLPQINRKQLQSVGIGLRYHTPVGPLRLDVAFPLNRRKHLDSFCQIYFSVGQAF